MMILVPCNPLSWLDSVSTIKIGIITAVIPPPSFVWHCTVIGPLVIVYIIRSKLVAIMMSHSIKHVVLCPTSCSQCECVVSTWPTNLYRLVCPVEGHSVSGLHVNPQLHLPVAGETVDVPQPVPELSLQVPEAILIVLPVASEVCLAIGEPSLNDQPPTTICTHITAS